MKKFILFLSCSIAISVFSQPLTVEAYRDMSLQELMEIKVVSACQVEQMATEAPATVYVITHQQIKERNYTCLRDVLSQIPQIEIQRKVHSQHTDIYTINGVTGNEKFLILMDGIRVNSTTGTEHTLGESYSLGNVQRVEVILGPASALYGADAFTGIINIITNTGYENKGLSLTSEGGMYNTIANTLVYGVGNEDISFAFTGKQYHSDEPFFPTYYPKEYEWYTHYAQTGEMLSFKDTVSTGAIQPWATPTDAYSLIGRLNVKAFEFGYSRLQESHSTSFGNLPSTHIHSSDALYANHFST